MKDKANLIDHETIAIESFFTNGYRSKVTKLNDVYYSEKSPTELLNEACIIYASTLEGRKQAVVQTFNFYKPPFIIAPFEVGFFPTKSSKSYDCMYISSHPFTLTKIKKGRSRLDFYNSIHIDVDVSPHTLNQQQQRLHTVINYFRTLSKMNQ